MEQFVEVNSGRRGFLLELQHRVVEIPSSQIAIRKIWSRHVVYQVTFQSVTPTDNPKHFDTEWGRIVGPTTNERADQAVVGLSHLLGKYLNLLRGEDDDFSASYPTIVLQRIRHVYRYKIRRKRRSKEEI
jgi:hypothetical protein